MDDPLNDMIGRESFEKLVAPLDPEGRRVMTLRYRDGYSMQEAAQILDVPVGKMQAVWVRAMGQLRSAPGAPESAPEGEPAQGRQEE